MEDLPPPPYTVSDPQRSSRSTYLPRYLASLNTQSLFRRSSVTRQSSAPSPSSGHYDQHISPQTSHPPSTAPRTLDGARDELDRSGFVSAASYFELRPPKHERPRNTFFYHMSVSWDASLESLPFPRPRRDWMDRWVDEIDWSTFLKFLLLPHGVEGSGNTRESSSSISRDQSLPLLENSRSNYGPETERLRRLRHEAVRSQWNEGFFGPRGLEIRFETNDAVLSMIPRIPQIPPLPSTPPIPPVPQITTRKSSSSVLQKKIPAEKEETLLHQAVGKGKKSHVKLLLQTGSEDIEAVNKKLETCLFRAVSKGEKEILQLLLENGADPNTRPPGADSPLHIACSNDRKLILKYLLEASTAGIEETNGKGETPLYVAMQRRKDACIELLLDAGANPMSRPAGKDSMLNLAVANDCKSIAKLLLQKGVDVEETKGGDTPLCRAISKGATSMVKILLEFGASTASSTSKGDPPLSLAISRGDKSIVTMLLEQKNIDIEAPSHKQETPLWQAISRGHTSIAELLLRKGARPGDHPRGEESALNLAIGRGNTPIVNLLLEAGADVQEKNRSGQAPLFQAVSRADSSIIALLLAKGADPNTRDIAGESVLQKAVGRSDTSAVSVLLGSGADPDLKIVCGESPLYLAVHRSSTPLTSLLLSHGANPESRSSNGEMPLWRAIYLSSTSIVSLLLARGADPSSKTMSGDTMYDYAVKKGNATIVQLLASFSVPKSEEKVLLVRGVKDGLGGGWGKS